MFKTRIFDRKWKVFLHTGDRFAKRFGGGDAAVTLPGLKEMHFCEDELDIVTVIHECVHAYFDGMNTSAAKLSLDQQEEVFCELFANSGQTILKHGRILLRDLQDERDRR